MFADGHAEARVNIFNLQEQQVTLPVTAVPGPMWDFAVASGRAVLSIPSKMVGVWQAAFGGEDREGLQALVDVLLGGSDLWSAFGTSG